jgi:hypothetical protein
VFSNDPSLFFTLDAARSSSNSKPSIFESEQTIYRYVNNTIKTYVVDHVIELSGNQADYHCMEVSTNECCVLRSSYEELFSTMEQANMHAFKVKKIYEEASGNQEPVYVDFVNRKKAGDVIYDVENGSIRTGTIMEVYDWPNGKGCIYSIDDMDQPGSRYHFHSDSPFIAFDLMTAAEHSNTTHVKKEFNMDSVVYDVGLDNSISRYRVVTVRPMGRLIAYGIISDERPVQCIIYSDSNDVWGTLGEAKHYAMKRKFEEGMFMAYDPRSPCMATAFERSPSPEPSEGRARCASVDLGCYEDASSPTKFVRRSPTPLELTEPAIASSAPPVAPKRKKARRERKALLEYGKSPIFKSPADTKRVPLQPKRLGYHMYCVKCRAQLNSDDE